MYWDNGFSTTSRGTASRNVPQKNRIEVKYETLINDPFTQIKRIYEDLNIPGLESIEEDIKKYLDQQKKLKQNIQKQQVRIVAENADFLTFPFFASRFPFEMWVLPKSHSARFETLPARGKMTLAQIMKKVFNKL